MTMATKPKAYTSQDPSTQNAPLPTAQGTCFISCVPLSRVDLQVDLIEQMGPLPFNLEFFTECQDMRQLLAYLDAPPDTGEALDGAEDEGEQDDQSRDRGNGGSEAGREDRIQRQDGGEAEAAGRVDGDDDVSGGGAAGDGDGGKRRRGRSERFHKLTEEICDVVDSYGLVCFYPLNIQVCLFPSPRNLCPRL